MRARARPPSGKSGKKPKPPPVRRAATKAATPPRPKAEKPEVRIFVSYSHKDADARARLETHLAPLKRDNVATWFDGDMEAGDKLDTGIARALRNAHIFVGLLSPDYLASNYCWNIEYRRAMSRRARGKMRVVAVALKPSDWKSTVAAGFKLLPDDAREVIKWRSADIAYLNIAQGIRRVVAAVRKNMTLAADAAPRKKPSTTRARKPVSTSKTAPKPAAARKPARTRPAVRTASRKLGRQPGA